MRDSLKVTYAANQMLKTIAVIENDLYIIINGTAVNFSSHEHDHWNVKGSQCCHRKGHILIK